MTVRGVLAAAVAGVVAALVLVAGPARASTMAVELDQRSGLPRLVMGGDAMTASHVFWGKDWAWANFDLRARPKGPFELDLTGQSEPLGLIVTGTVKRPADNQLRWDWTFTARATVPQAIGGGIAFTFEDAHRARLGDPVALPGNRGWRWGREGGDRVEMVFDPPLASVHLERGAAREVRALIYKDSVPAGLRQLSATLTVHGNVKIRPALEQRIGLDRLRDWPGVPLDWAGAPIDLSFLNADDKPAGKRGFVKADGDRLVFADGSPARFWGTNLSAYAVFATPRNEVCGQAKRLARLGFNLVRIHHHDSPWVEPNIFGPLATPNTQQVAPESIAKIDWWIKCLRDEGIRVWLDLHVQRALEPGDGITHFAELLVNDNKGDLKGFNYVNRSIQQAMDRFALQYLEHRNPHTGLRYLDDPAVMAVQVTNENDVTHHFGNKMLPDKNVPRHWELLKAASDAFADRNRLSRDRTWRTWEHGPSKLFLNDLERGVHAATIARLRERGLKVPAATTNFWGDNPLATLPALTAGDIVDAHAYGRAGELERNPLLQATLGHRLAVAHVTGRPFTVSEWNLDQNFPSPDRHVIPLYVAATAAHQGWDAMMLYAYAQGPIDGPGKPDNWHAMNDPSLMVPIAAAALLYRQAHVREASAVYAWAPNPQTLFNTPVTPDNSPALRTAAERGKLVVVMPPTPELPWLQAGRVPPGATLLRDHLTPVLPSEAASVTSDHGELERDWGVGRFTVRTPRSQGVAGWLGREPITLPDVTVALANPHASVTVQSMGAEPIAQSRQILVTLATVAMPDAAHATSLFLGQPADGSLSIKAPAGLALLAPKDGRLQPSALPMSYADGRYTIRFNGRDAHTWLVLQPRAR